ncbi:hypothetical protein LSAT2_028006 [Lamellibrachia satsuma]|nr:hypothetical protein LSAT2_028006 [Lamellibrachia satsuma]
MNGRLYIVHVVNVCCHNAIRVSSVHFIAPSFNGPPLTDGPRPRSTGSGDTETGRLLGPDGLPSFVRMRRARSASRLTKYNLWQSVPQTGTWTL